jgi:hypothetical protein
MCCGLTTAPGISACHLILFCFKNRKHISLSVAASYSHAHNTIHDHGQQHFGSNSTSTKRTSYRCQKFTCLRINTTRIFPMFYFQLLLVRGVMYWVYCTEFIVISLLYWVYLTEIFCYNLTHGLLTRYGQFPLLCIQCSVSFCDIVLLCVTVFLLCILPFTFLFYTVPACNVLATILTEVYPCFFLSCKANARI